MSDRIDPPFDSPPLGVWQVYDRDNRWGTIAAIGPRVGPSPIPLVVRDRKIADGFAPLARAHGAAIGRPVRLVRYMPVEVMAYADRLVRFILDHIGQVYDVDECGRVLEVRPAPGTRPPTPPPPPPDRPASGAVSW